MRGEKSIGVVPAAGGLLPDGWVPLPKRLPWGRTLPKMEGGPWPCGGPCPAGGCCARGPVTGGWPPLAAATSEEFERFRFAWSSPDEKGDGGGIARVAAAGE